MAYIQWDFAGGFVDQKTEAAPLTCSCEPVYVGSALKGMSRRHDCEMHGNNRAITRDVVPRYIGGSVVYCPPEATREEAERAFARAEPALIGRDLVIDRSPVADLTPLRDLATAVEWGLALEAALTRWREWHPDARVTWDITDMTGDPVLRLRYSVVGIGVVREDDVQTHYENPTGYLQCSVGDAEFFASREMAKRWRA